RALPRRRAVRAVPAPAGLPGRSEHHQGARAPRRSARRHPRRRHALRRRRRHRCVSFSEDIIAEFRANGGVVTRPYPDSTLVLVTMRGAKSGRERTLPLEFFEIGGVAHVYATRSGSPQNPAWYHNVLANPDVTVEQGTETYRARARELHGAERDAAWN